MVYYCNWEEKNRENVASQNFSFSCRVTYSKQDVKRNHNLTKFKLWKVIALERALMAAMKDGAK